MKILRKIDAPFKGQYLVRKMDNGNWCKWGNKKEALQIFTQDVQTIKEEIKRDVIAVAK